MLKSANLLLLVALASFVLQSETVQFVEGTQKYYRPWFLLLFSHSIYTLFLPTQYFIYSITKKSGADYRNWIMKETNSLPMFGVPPNPVHLGARIFWLSLLFNLAAISWYISVSKIPIAEITAIYNTSCFFTYILSVIFLNEEFIWPKFFAVINSIMGIFIIASGNGLKLKFDSESAVGYGFAVLSSFFAAAYEVIYSRSVVPKKPSANFTLYITGWIGVYTFITSIFLLPFLHLSGLEEFSLPPLSVWPFILLVALFGIIFNSTFLMVIAFTSPTFASVGILLTIPLASFADYVFFDSHVKFSLIFGSILIVLGFGILKCYQQPHEFEEDSESENDSEVPETEDDPLLNN